MPRRRLMRSATFLIEWPASDEQLFDIMSAVSRLHNSGDLNDFTVKGVCGSDSPGKLRVEGTSEGIAKVAALLESEPLLTADVICGWCLEREADELVEDDETTPSITVGICEVCRSQGLSQRLLRWKTLVAKG